MECGIDCATIASSPLAHMPQLSIILRIVESISASFLFSTCHTALAVQEVPPALQKFHDSVHVVAIMHYPQINTYAVVEKETEHKGIHDAYTLMTHLCCKTMSIWFHMGYFEII